MYLKHFKNDVFDNLSVFKAFRNTLEALSVFWVHV